MHGVSVPGRRGHGESEARAGMLADDLAIYLRDYDSLPGLARVVST